MYDVIIIGCGITGAAAAFELSKYHLKVCVLERENDVATGTTKANSAILHAGYDPQPGSLMARLNVRGAELAKQLCMALNVPYRQTGSVVAAFSESELPVLEELYRRGRANGVPDLTILGGEQAREKEPGLAPGCVGALYAPTAAICSPWEYCLALAETAVRNGVDLRLETPVVGAARTENGWQVETESGRLEGRFVINAAGVSAGQVHDMAAGHTFSILPSRGEYFLLDKSEGSRVQTVVFQCPGAEGKGVLVAPTVHGNLLVGPSSEAVEGEDCATRADVLAAVRTTALQAVPDIRFGASIRNFAGVRARSDQPDFILEESAPGWIDLAGICSPGLTAAPAIAEYAVSLLKQAGLTLSPKDNHICTRRRVRFRELNHSQRAALVAQRSDYGHIICRCETVTEGEITDALSAPIPPRSVDGIKRRVGAGLGRCQGGFCSPRVVEMLCRALGVSPLELPQEGVGSYILTDKTKGGHRYV